MSAPTTKLAIFLGVYLAHDRVVAVAVDENGREIAQSTSAYIFPPGPPPPKGRVEQDPEIWWDATRLALGHLTTQLRSASIVPSQLRGISVSGTPGTIVVQEREGKILCPAIMHNDSRANEQVPKLNTLGADHCKKMGFKFQADDSIAKIAWVKNNLPELYEFAIFVHQTDYILGKLKGTPDVTEFSIATRTGCDLIDENWPDWLDYDMHLGVRERLPRLVHLGEIVGNLSPAAASATGLPQGIPVVMGTASETAAFLATGAKKLGDFYLDLDDHISICGITKKLIIYPHHLVQMSKLPNLAWFFSTECTAGADWIKDWFKDASLVDIEAEAEKLLPTNYLAYPNTKKGELFPFCANSAEGFISPATDNRTVQFASCLQGTGFFERMCYEKIDKLADLQHSTGDIYTGGPWNTYDSWMQCRADITGRINRRTQTKSAPAFGTALIAAIGTHFKNFEAAAENMVHIDQSFFPNPDRMTQYNEKYIQFLSIMEGQGYM